MEGDSNCPLFVFRVRAYLYSWTKKKEGIAAQFFFYSSAGSSFQCGNFASFCAFILALFASYACARCIYLLPSFALLFSSFRLCIGIILPTEKIFFIYFFDSWPDKFFSSKFSLLFAGDRNFCANLFSVICVYNIRAKFKPYRIHYRFLCPSAKSKLNWTFLGAYTGIESKRDMQRLVYVYIPIYTRTRG